MPLLSCPHCGSALAAPADETTPLRCPICGATLGTAAASEELSIQEAIVREEDDSATRAVAPERMAPIIARATTDHYAAQIADAQSAIVRPADETTQALPFAATPASGADPHELTQELPPSSQPPQPPASRPLRGALRAASLTLAALTLVAVVIVTALAANGVIIGGASSSSQLAATATSVVVSPTATPALTVFTVANYYQVSYPQGWVAQQRNNPPKSYFALLTAPSGGASVNIEAQQAKGAPALVDLDQQFLNALAQPGTTPTPGGSPTTVSVGGEPWTQLTAEVTLRVPSGQPAQYAHVVALSTQHGDAVYTIVRLVPSASAAAAGPAFTTADEAYFQPLLASFAFAS